MSLDEIRKSTKATIRPIDAAAVLGCNPQCIRIMAREAPERLGFPVFCVGNRVKIPRLPFLAFMGCTEGVGAHE